eukprot:SAG31_NODE_4151_length_3528_cov_2.301546_1_plen_773_part_10
MSFASECELICFCAVDGALVCAKIDTVDLTADEVILLDTNPKKYGVRWVCKIEQLQLAAAAVAAHTDGNACGGVLTVAKSPLFGGEKANLLDCNQLLFTGGDTEHLALPMADGDCYRNPPAWLPQIEALDPSELVPCQQLATLCAALSAIESRTEHDADPCVSVPALCHQLGLPLSTMLDLRPTLSELADYAQQWIDARGLDVQVSARYCDQTLETEAAFQAALATWSDLPAVRRPVTMIYYSRGASQIKSVAAGARPSRGEHHVSLLAGYSVATNEVILAETSVRHSVSSWSLSVPSLFTGCAASSSMGRPGGLLELAPSGASIPENNIVTYALGGSVSDNIFSSLSVPQFRNVLPAVALTSVAVAVEALLAAHDNQQKASTLEIAQVSDSGPSIALPLDITRPISVDDIVASGAATLQEANDSACSFSCAYTAAAKYVSARRLPISIEGVHADNSALTEAVFRTTIKRAAAALNEVLVLHFSLAVARDIVGVDGQGHAAAVAGYIESTDEVLLADANPRDFRKLWQRPIKQIFAACAEAAPGGGRARGLIRLTLLSVIKHQQLVAAHARGECEIDPAFEVSTHQIGLTRSETPAAVTWPTLSPGAHPGLAACALAIRVATRGEHIVAAAGITAAQNYPPWAACPGLAHKLRWPLLELATATQGYVQARGMHLLVQAVAFSSAINDKDKFRRELERGIQRPGSAYVVAFRPADAHNAPRLAEATEVFVDYSLITDIDVLTGLVELIDLSPKHNFGQWACHVEKLFSAMAFLP